MDLIRNACNFWNYFENSPKKIIEVFDFTQNPKLTLPKPTDSVGFTGNTESPLHFFQRLCTAAADQFVVGMSVITREWRMDIERSSLCNCVVNFLLEEKYLLTAFELLQELLEDGRDDQAIRLKQFFSDSTQFPPDLISRFNSLRGYSNFFIFKMLTVQI